MENNIGERIVGLRKKKGLTQLQLAEKLNISDKAVSKWESGKGDPSVEMLGLLSELFDCSIDYLVKGKERSVEIVKVLARDDAKTEEKLSLAEETWNKVLEIVRPKVSELSYEVWISLLKPINIVPGFLPDEFSLVLSVPTVSSKNIIVKKFDKLLNNTLMKVNEDIPYIIYRVEDIFSDPFFKLSVKLAIVNKGVSVSFLQRKLQIGYSRAARIVDAMEDMHFISSINGSKLRDVYIDKNKFEETFEESFDSVGA